MTLKNDKNAKHYGEENMNSIQNTNVCGLKRVHALACKKLEILFQFELKHTARIQRTSLMPKPQKNRLYLKRVCACISPHPSFPTYGAQPRLHTSATGTKETLFSLYNFVDPSLIISGWIDVNEVKSWKHMWYNVSCFILCCDTPVLDCEAC